MFLQVVHQIRTAATSPFGQVMRTIDDRHLGVAEQIRAGVVAFQGRYMNLVVAERLADKGVVADAIFRNR